MSSSVATNISAKSEEDCSMMVNRRPLYYDGYTNTLVHYADDMEENGISTPYVGDGRRCTSKKNSRSIWNRRRKLLTSSLVPFAKHDSNFPLSDPCMCCVPPARIGNENREVSSLRSRVLDLLECPVCFETIYTSIFQCVNGHVFCEKCLPHLQGHCPVCRTTLNPPIRNRCLESILGIFSFPCRFQCNTFVSFAKMLDHERICLLRPLQCPCSGCNWTGRDTDLVQHLLNSHPRILNLDGAQIVFLATEINAPGKRLSWMMIQHCYKRYFLLSLERCERDVLPANLFDKLKDDQTIVEDSDDLFYPFSPPSTVSRDGSATCIPSNHIVNSSAVVPDVSGQQRLQGAPHLRRHHNHHQCQTTEGCRPDSAASNNMKIGENYDEAGDESDDYIYWATVQLISTDCSESGMFRYHIDLDDDCNIGDCNVSGVRRKKLSTMAQMCVSHLSWESSIHCIGKSRLEMLKNDECLMFSGRFARSFILNSKLPLNVTILRSK